MRNGDARAIVACYYLHTRAGLVKQLDNYLALGQVVGVHIARRFIRDGMYDTVAAQPIMRAGYRGDYAGIGEMFEMIRPA